MNNSLEFALQFAEKGWYVFPILPGSKYPFNGFEWRLQSVNDPIKIKAAAAHHKYKNCNWALDCGKSEIFVVDLDVKENKNGIETWKNVFGGEAGGDTLTVRTASGGQHLYYKGRGKNTQSSLGVGIDTRGDGGYVLLPGSVVSGSGIYSVLKDTEPAPMPETLTQIIKPPTERKEDYAIPICEPDKETNVERAVKWLSEHAPEAVQGSGGDAVTFQVACRLRDFNVSEATALELLCERWNETKAFPPWDTAELEKKVQNAFKYAKDRPGNDTPEAMFSGNVPSTEVIKCAAETRIDQLQPRNWLLGHRYLLGFTTLTIAPGGAGKSLLTILEALSIASGKRLTHDEIKLQGAVWLFNTEDPFDELSMRIMAAAKYYNLTQEDLENFYYSSAYDNPLTLVSYDDRGRPVINQTLIDAIVKQIQKRSIKLFILDPFVECHQVNENDNSAINMVMRSFRKIAKETNCAISIVHHTSKGSKDTHGNMDKARGASALASAARIAHTFYTMSEKEAVTYGIAPKKASWYTRLDSAKANLAPPSESFEWFEKKSVKLFYDNDETTGVMEAVELDQVVGSGSNSHIAELARLIVDRDGPTSLLKIAKEVKRSGGYDKSERTLTEKLEEIFSVTHELNGKEYLIDPTVGTKRVLTCWDRGKK